VSDPEQTLPPDPLASTIPSPPPEHEPLPLMAERLGYLPGPLIAGHPLRRRAEERPAWFYSDEWDGFASEELDE
jgi:hypothetical protein